MTTTYRIRQKSDGKEISCDWQNASELVSHGYWEWASGNGAKEFKRAQRDAKGNPPTSGFDHLGEVPDGDNDDDDDDRAPAAPAPVVAAPVAPAAPSIADIAAAKATADVVLEDMSRDELFAFAAEKFGLTLDKRTGTKNVITAIKAKQEEATR